MSDGGVVVVDGSGLSAPSPTPPVDALNIRSTSSAESEETSQETNIAQLDAAVVYQVLTRLRYSDARKLSLLSTLWRDEATAAVRYIDRHFSTASRYLWHRCSLPEDISWNLEGRAGMAMCYVDREDCIYSFGGMCKGPSAATFNDLWKFDMSTLRWTRVLIRTGPFPSPKAYARLIYDPSRCRLLLTGGCTQLQSPSTSNSHIGFMCSATSADQHYAYSLRDKKWTALTCVTEVERKHSQAACLSLDSRLLITYGGIDVYTRSSSELRWLDLERMEWINPVINEPCPSAQIFSDLVPLSPQLYLLVGGKHIDASGIGRGDRERVPTTWLLHIPDGGNSKTASWFKIGNHGCVPQFSRRPAWPGALAWCRLPRMKQGERDKMRESLQVECESDPSGHSCVRSGRSEEEQTMAEDIRESGAAADSQPTRLLMLAETRLSDHSDQYNDKYDRVDAAVRDIVRSFQEKIDLLYSKRRAWLDTLTREQMETLDSGRAADRKTDVDFRVHGVRFTISNFHNWEVEKELVEKRLRVEKQREKEQEENRPEGLDAMREWHVASLMGSPRETTLREAALIGRQHPSPDFNTLPLPHHMMAIPMRMGGKSPRWSRGSRMEMGIEMGEDSSRLLSPHDVPEIRYKCYAKMQTVYSRMHMGASCSFPDRPAGDGRAEEEREVPRRRTPRYALLVCDVDSEELLREGVIYWKYIEQEWEACAVRNGVSLVAARGEILMHGGHGDYREFGSYLLRPPTE